MIIFVHNLITFLLTTLVIIVNYEFSKTDITCCNVFNALHVTSMCSSVIIVLIQTSKEQGSNIAHFVEICQVLLTEIRRKYLCLCLKYITKLIYTSHFRDLWFTTYFIFFPGTASRFSLDIGGIWSCWTHNAFTWIG